MLRAILMRTMRPIFIGAASGSVLAIVAARVLREPLIAINTFDPIGLGGAVVFVVLVGLLASLIPARRSLRVDPMTTLRYE